MRSGHMAKLAHCEDGSLPDTVPAVYGSEYIGLRRGDAVVLLERSAGEAEDAQWTYGQVDGSRGWFHTAYVEIQNQIQIQIQIQIQKMKKKREIDYEDMKTILPFLSSLFYF